MYPQFQVLQSGHRMPTMGLGTYTLLGDGLDSALRHAIQIGYRHIDTAPSYENEADIGKTLSKLFESEDIIREDLFITSKLPRTHLDKEGVAICIDKILKDLQLDYLDLLLIHSPWSIRRTPSQDQHQEKHPEKDIERVPNKDLESDDIDQDVRNKDQDVSDVDCDESRRRDVTRHYRQSLIDTWAAMSESVSSGRVRSLGVSNFTLAQIESIHDAVQDDQKIDDKLRRDNKLSSGEMDTRRAVLLDGIDCRGSDPAISHNPASSDPASGSRVGGGVCCGAGDVVRNGQSRLAPLCNVQLECHPFCQQCDIVDFCQRNGVAVTAYSPLGAPSRPKRFRDPQNDFNCMSHPVVLDIAKKYSSSPAQVILSHHLSRNIIPIPKSSKFDNLSSNYDSYKLNLSQNDIEMMGNINMDEKFFRFEWLQKHPHYKIDELF